jgi:hypothetical protein
LLCFVHIDDAADDAFGAEPEKIRLHERYAKAGIRGKSPKTIITNRIGIEILFLLRENK